MAGVRVIPEGPTAGIWVTADNGSMVGLVAAKEGAYVALYDRTDGSHMPVLALSKDGVQVAENGKIESVSVVPFSALKSLKKLLVGS